MDPVTGLVAGQAIQTLAKAALGDSESSSSESSQDFSTQLARLLSPDPANNINEEELYAGLIEERIGATKGEEAAQAFAESFAAKKAEMARGDGYIPVEDAANAALEEMVASGALSADEAKTIGDQAFQAAQLDDNLDALYDSRGGGNDPTIATASMEVALVKAKDALTSLGVSIAGGDSEEASDTETEASVSDATEANVETITPNGTTIDGAGLGFLFKPDSESGPLVVLTPAALAQQIESVVLKDADGKELERGRSSGYANPGAGGEGEREHWRFNSPGASYGENITVEVTLKNGEVRKYEIPDPSKRYD